MTIPPTNYQVVDEILKTLKESSTFCLSGHQNPDADVVGSQLALASLIERLGPGKVVDIQNLGHPPKSLSYLAGFDSVQSRDKVDKNYDVVVVFECSGADRMGNIIDLKTQAKKVINIDHHLHNPNFGTVNFVEPHTSSTAELIFKIFDRGNFPLQRNEAIALFTGMVADTGWFRYSNTNTQTLNIAERLLATGIPIADLAERVYMSRTAVAMKLLGWCLSNMRLFFNDRVALLTIPEEIYRSFGAGPDDVEEIVNHGLKIDSVMASVLLKEKKEQHVVKASLRSKGTFDINRVARVFGGGGHKNASGCSIPGDLNGAEKQVLKELSQILES